MTTADSTVIPNEATDLLCIDVETAGPNLVKNFMLEFSAAVIRVGSDTPYSIYYRSLAQPDKTTWDAHTLNDFWAKPDDKTGIAPILALNKRRDTVPMWKPAAAMDDFVRWVRARNDEVRARGGMLMIVTDTAGFDVKWIDYYLSAHGTLDVCELCNVFGYYQSTRDISSFMLGIAGQMLAHGSSEAAMRKMKRNKAANWGERYAHDHNPENDAQHIAATSSYMLTAVGAK